MWKVGGAKTVGTATAFSVQTYSAYESHCFDDYSQEACNLTPTLGEQWTMEEWAYSSVNYFECYLDHNTNVNL